MCCMHIYSLYSACFWVSTDAQGGMRPHRRSDFHISCQTTQRFRPTSEASYQKAMVIIFSSRGHRIWNTKAVIGNMRSFPSPIHFFTNKNSTIVTSAWAFESPLGLKNVSAIHKWQSFVTHDAATICDQHISSKSLLWNSPFFAVGFSFMTLIDSDLGEMTQRERHTNKICCICFLSLYNVRLCLEPFIKDSEDVSLGDVGEHYSYFLIFYRPNN